jgi:hypothetical protein
MQAGDKSINALNVVVSEERTVDLSAVETSCRTTDVRMCKSPVNCEKSVMFRSCEGT